MATIKDGNGGTDQLSIGATSKAARITPYDVNGVVGLPLPAGASTETTLAAINTKTPPLGQAAMAAATPIVVASDQSVIPTVLKTDAGVSLGKARNMFSLTAMNFTSAVAEGLITLTPAVDYANASTLTSYQVPAGKTLVLLGLSLSTRNAGAAGQGIRCAIRVSPSGAVTTASPVLAILGVGTNLAIANITGGATMGLSQLPFGTIEIAATFQIGITQIGTATAGGDVSLWGYLV